MSGRYQSTVFNFFSRQSMRLQDQSAKTWRQAKIAAVWGVQILLYPIYVAFQSSRLAVKQLRQTSRQTTVRLQAAKQGLTRQPDSIAASDRPIRKTLQSLTSLQVEQLNQQMLLLPAEAHPDVERELALYVRHHPELHQEAAALQTTNPEVADIAAIKIQGVASSIATHDLVLITTRNQVLDVLTAEQQAQLSQRIVWETATYWRQQRLQTAQSALLVSRRLSLTKPQHNAWLPVQVFQKIMAWMQRGSVATAADLFQETQLTLYTPTPLALQGQHPDGIRSAEPSWVALETQFYDWLEKAGRTATGAIISVVELGLAAWSRSQPSSDPQIIALDAAKPTSPDNSSNSTSIASPHQTPIANIKPVPNRPQWLNQLDRWLSQVPSLKQESQPPQPILPPAQPWLTMDDLSTSETLLHPTSEIAPAPPPPAQDNWLQRSLRNLLPNRSAISRTQPPQTENWEMMDTAALESAIKKQFTKLRQPKSKRSKSALVQQKSSRSVVHSTPQPELSFNPRSTEAIEPLEVPLSSLDTANLEEAAMMPSSWIEAEAQMVGYVKHPLEQVLEWLDRGMAWVETQVAKLWRWLTRAS